MIISATLLSVLNWMRLGMDPQSAINSQRFHHQWFPDRVRMEGEFSAEMEQALRARGYDIEHGWQEKPSLSKKSYMRIHLGIVNAIAIDPATGDRLGAADPRHNGSAAGY